MYKSNILCRCLVMKNGVYVSISENKGGKNMNRKVFIIVGEDESLIDSN